MPQEPCTQVSIPFYPSYSRYHVTGVLCSILADADADSDEADDILWVGVYLYYADQRQ